MKFQVVKVLTVGLAIAASGPAFADDAAAKSPGQAMDDAGIAASVKTKLMGDTSTKARQINVETSKGIVQLNGFVDSAEARDEAGKIAAATGGVVSVRNNLEVRPADRSTSEVIDDAGLTAKVDAALAGDSRTSALRIDVATREGTVQLQGFAKSEAEKKAATEVANSVNGVRAVQNVMAVQ